MLLTRHPCLVTLLASALWTLLSLAAPARTSAQTPFMSTQLAFGSGITWGNGPADQTVSRRSPMFVDAAMRTWSSEEPSLMLGGSLRMEIEGRTSIGVVPRVEILKKLGSITLLPGAGIPLFFSPFSMIGVEVSTAMLMPLSDAFSLSAAATFDGYFFGSDVPDKSAVIMFNLMIGASLAI